MMRWDCDECYLTPGQESEIGGSVQVSQHQGLLLGGACESDMCVHMTHGLLGRYAEKQLCVGS